jgi:uncharacterized protein
MTERASSNAPASHLGWAAILSLGLFLAACVLGWAFVSGRQPAGTVRVVGAATVPFTSDVVKWRVQLVRTVGGGEEASGYQQLSDDRVRLLSTLEDAGVPREDVSVQPVTTNPMYGREGQVTGTQLRQMFLVVGSSVDEVESVALDPGDLLQSGLGLEGSQIEYFYDGIAELKRDLLARAADDARARATEIVGEGLGALIEARAGVFQIREPYSTEVEGYGVYNTGTRAKEITVTVHATYRLH